MSVKCENYQEFSLKITASLLKCIQLLQILKIELHIGSTLPFIYTIFNRGERQETASKPPYRKKPGTLGCFPGELVLSLLLQEQQH